MQRQVHKTQSLGTEGARSLAITTNSRPMVVGITPRWLLKMLPWVEVTTGVYRIPCRKIVLPDLPKVKMSIHELQDGIRGYHLKDIHFLQDLEMDSLDRLAQQFTLQEYEPNQTIIEEEDRKEAFYILIKGKAEATRIGSYRNKVHLAVYGEGDTFGECTLLKNTQRTATVKALTHCYVLALSSDKFEEMIESSSLIREDIEENMNNQIALENELNEYGEKKVLVASDIVGERELPETYVEYEETPKEYLLHVIQTVLKINTRVSDIYNEPHNQLEEQLRLTVEAIKEKQEWEMINHKKYGLLNQVIPSQQIETRIGPPMPDDLDELIAKVWKEPSFFLAHPKAIAAFGRECTRRGVPPVVVEIYGSPFMTWRGIPIVPCDKLLVNGKTRTDQLTGTTNILLLRVGEENQGVVGLLQTGIENEQSLGLSVRYMGINNKSIASYLVTTYFNTAVLTDDAIGVLKDVEIGNYYDYELYQEEYSN